MKQGPHFDEPITRDGHRFRHAPESQDCASKGQRRHIPLEDCARAALARYDSCFKVSVQWHEDLAEDSATKTDLSKLIGRLELIKAAAGERTHSN
jgi:hypothetical protein